MDLDLSRQNSVRSPRCELLGLSQLALDDLLRDGIELIPCEVVLLNRRQLVPTIIATPRCA